MRKLIGGFFIFFVTLVIYLWYQIPMNKFYTTHWVKTLVLGWVLLSGVANPGAIAQDCIPELTHINVLPTERVIDGVVHKRVQVVVNNAKPGPAGRFYFLFDGASRDTSTKSYEYGYNTEVFLVPIDVEKITFYDFNSFNCNFEYFPDFSPNRCTFNFDQYIDLSAGDCYNRTVTYSVSGDVVIDSVAWLRNGSSTPVHDQMSWVNIPPGSYEIYFYDDQGCEATTNLSTCTSKTEAGDDQILPYCIGEDDTLNLYELLSGEVDSGGFFTEEYIPLDSAQVIDLTYISEDTYIYYYIAPASLEIPDTSQFTIQARDCSECAYELISAQRHCSDPETIEVTIGGGTHKDTTFRVTLPDGSMVEQTFYTPFSVHFPDYRDSFDLPVQWDTPTGTCDSTLHIAPVANPMIQISASEIDLPEDSVGIEVTLSQGVAPYQLDVFVGDQQRFLELGAGETGQLHFLLDSDTAILMAMDDQGCMGADTLVLTPDCIRPDIAVVHDVCGTGAGQILLDPSPLPSGSQIAWTDTSEAGLWERSLLTPGTYRYTVTYDECAVEDDIIVEGGSPQIPELSTLNDCLLDGEVEILVQDSSRVRQWAIGGKELPHFTGYFPANQDLIFNIETVEGCMDTVAMRVEEEPWLDQAIMEEPHRVSVQLGIDVGYLSDYGWSRNDSLLCTSCEDYSEEVLPAGTYVFFAEQFPGCRRDTVLIIQEPELAFLMPNVITPTSGQNRMVQIFDPMDQMATILEFQVYDRFGNVLFQKYDFVPDDNSTINWPNGSATELPSVIICVARIRSKKGEEVTMTQDVLILR